MTNSLHWCDSNDEFRLVGDSFTYNGTTLCHENNEVSAKVMKFTIRGNPLPLQRHRKGNTGIMYNPSSASQKSFQDVLKSMFPPVHGKSLIPFFPAPEHLSISIIFYMKRPKSHFVGNKAGPGRLRSKNAPILGRFRTDVDNLAKFVLDCLNTVAYSDDHQVVSLRVIKLFHSEEGGNCDGATEVLIKKIDESDVHCILRDFRV